MKRDAARRSGYVVVVLAVAMACAVVRAADDLTLAAKAELFGVDLAERFFEEGQVRVRRRLPTDEHPYVTFNMSDTAYQTGMYCATQTWRYLVTGEDDAAQRAAAAADALVHLVDVTEQAGLLARASLPADVPWYDDGTWRVTSDGRFRWRGNVSSDQVDAFMFGLYVYGRHLATGERRQAVARAVATVTDAIIANDYRIVGFDGRPTRWGHYEPDYVVGEEPMNALLMLQMVKIAQMMTGAPRFDEAYRHLIDRGYATIGVDARENEPPLEVNHSDDVLIALALYPLLELEREPAVRNQYLDAARRWFRGVDHPGVDVESNPFASFLYGHWTGEADTVPNAVETLRDVPLDMKWNPDTIAGYRRRFGFAFSAEPVGDVAGPGPLPIGQRGRTWSFLVHNPYRVGGNRLEAAPFETNGLDFLLSYWFGRAHGFIEASW